MDKTQAEAVTWLIKLILDPGGSSILELRGCCLDNQQHVGVQ